MPDFHQPGPVISLPLIRDGDGAALERDIADWAVQRPLALLLPCHVRDLESPALAGIMHTIAGIPWISRILLGLDGADAAQARRAAEICAPAGARCEVIWHGPGESQGNGLNLARLAEKLTRYPDIFAAAMHDCDVRTYSRGFLARLCWPVLHPVAGMVACKGYYARATDKLHGRVFRLMFQPLLRAAVEVLGPLPWLQFLQSLRYPLSGELCLRTDVLRQLSFDSGWGVEIMLLHGLFQSAASGTICQAELCPSYDHKHQEPADLARMAHSVAGTFLRTLPMESPAAIISAFEACVQRALREAELTASMNDLAFDPNAESALANQFTLAIIEASHLTPPGASAELP